MRRSAFHVVYDESDHVDGDRFLRSLHAPDSGRLVVHASPDATTLCEVAWDVLLGLGKRPMRTGVIRNERQLWMWLAAWLVATEIESIFISRAHLLSPRRWDALAGLAAETHAELWLLVQGASLTRTQRRTLEEWPVEEWNLRRFQQRFRACVVEARKAKRRRTPAPFPDVPHSDFTLFRATCRRQLSKSDFARVDWEFLVTREQTERWFGMPAKTDDEVIALYLQELMRGTSLPRAITRIRAAQVVLRGHGILVLVDVGRLAAFAAAEHRPELTDDVARALRAHAHPRYAASACLSLALHLSPAELVGLDLGDVAADGSSVTVGGREYPVPEPGRDLVRAHRLNRLMAGAESDGPFFAAETKERELLRMTARGMNQRLRQAATATGVFSVSHWSRSTAEAARTSLERRGIRIRRMA